MKHNNVDILLTVLLIPIDLANATCVITSDVAWIGDKPYYLKKNVNKALSSISLRSKSNIGSRCASIRSLDKFSQPDNLSISATELQQTLPSETGILRVKDGSSSLPIDVKRSKSQFIVLVSKYGKEVDDAKWIDEQDFNLQEV